MNAYHPSIYGDTSIRISGPGKSPVRLPFQVAAEAHLYYAGDESPSLFEVRTGLFRLSRLTRDGRRYVVGFGYPGDIIGYCPDGVHLSDCEAVVDSTVVRHPTETLTSCRADPCAHQALVQAALREIQEMQDHCMLLGHNLAHERVAAFLTRLSERIGRPQGDSVAFDLPMSRLDIADFLGLTVETVSRSLTTLRKAGIIEIRKLHRIVVLKPVRIDALAEADSKVAV